VNTGNQDTRQIEKNKTTEKTTKKNNEKKQKNTIDINITQMMRASNG